MRIETELSFGLEEYDRLPADPMSAAGEKDLLIPACKNAKQSNSSGFTCFIVKKSIDARKKTNIRVTFRVCLTNEMHGIQSEPAGISGLSGQASKQSLLSQTETRKIPKTHPAVIGFGPAGMMAALLLAREGLAPVIIERGSMVEKRSLDVERYFASGILSVHSNVQFGEGGAGTFSDGKLSTGVSDHRRAFVLDTFVAAGAPPEIKYLAHPHVGTDRLKTVVMNIRKEILSLGGTFLFERQVTGFAVKENILEGIYHIPCANPSDIEFLPCLKAVLAIGHSARDTFDILHNLSIPMTSKPFSVGVRIEHPQEWINRAQYGVSAGHRALPPADYKLVSHTAAGRSLYTFCMCPGGFVVASSSQEGQVVTNGMSNYLRDSQNANSAILVGVDAADFGEGVLSGVRYQEKLEQTAFDAGKSSGKAPCQRLGDFLENRASVSCGEVKPSYRPGVVYTNLRSLLPAYVSDAVCMGVEDMNRRLSGFSHPDSILTGFETRSSSPVRITRKDSMESLGLAGLFPCGEGAGYAGGIMSSAIDGMKIAEKIIENRFA